ncbi:MAG: hypothetical protein ACI8RZ_001977 [Myxococcota bacterium]|jgi:hypothetical protein
MLLLSLTLAGTLAEDTTQQEDTAQVQQVSVHEDLIRRRTGPRTPLLDRSRWGPRRLVPQNHVADQLFSDDSGVPGERAGGINP